MSKSNDVVVLTAGLGGAGEEEEEGVSMVWMVPYVVPSTGGTAVCGGSGTFGGQNVRKFRLTY